MSGDVDLIDFCDEFAHFRDSLCFFSEASGCLLEQSLEGEPDLAVVLGLRRFGGDLKSEFVRLQGLLDHLRKQSD